MLDNFNSNLRRQEKGWYDEQIIDRLWSIGAVAGIYVHSQFLFWKSPTSQTNLTQIHHPHFFTFPLGGGVLFTDLCTYGWLGTVVWLPSSTAEVWHKPCHCFRLDDLDRIRVCQFLVVQRCHVRKEEVVPIKQNVADWRTTENKRQTIFSSTCLLCTFCGWSVCLSFGVTW